MGVTGNINYYDTQASFDRVEFLRWCRGFAYSIHGNILVQVVWDTGQCFKPRDLEIIYFLRSIGIITSFTCILPVLQSNRINVLQAILPPSLIWVVQQQFVAFVVEAFGRFENSSMPKVFEYSFNLTLIRLVRWRRSFAMRQALPTP
ncbi:hypothetical protein PHMEG_0004786 [Phytophthora megakarya]|uniref:Uncharacterized protein n=1 Tax=Phytophthora megakarya TaxID=4795 RepID=A0A225WV37_9STRA|nr:hypothetical protein PHMEG_0004786 [Phytophthora megakarya]